MTSERKDPAYHDHDIEADLRRIFPDIHEQEARAAILAAANYVELRAGEVWLDIGGFIKSIPLVLRGTLKLVREDDNGNEMLLYYIGPGETCALSLTCCTGQDRSSIRVVAEDDTAMLTVPVRLMDEWTSSYRSWKTFVLLTYQRRFEELMRTIDGVAFQNLDERILVQLRERVRNQGSPVIATTHQEIASSLNSSREVISRLLKRMEHEGLVKLGRQRIELLAP